MGIQDFKSMGGVPIIGAPIVHEWRPVITFDCSCGKGKPLLITGSDRAAICSGCGSVYALAQLHYNRQKDEHGADIAIMKVKTQTQAGPATAAPGTDPN